MVDKISEPLAELFAMARAAKDIVAQLANASDTISVQSGELAQHTTNIGTVMTEMQQASQKASENSSEKQYD